MLSYQSRSRRAGQKVVWLRGAIEVVVFGMSYESWDRLEGYHVGTCSVNSPGMVRTGGRASVACFGALNLSELSLEYAGDQPLGNPEGEGTNVSDELGCSRD